MRREQVKDERMALLYLGDCQMATVESLAMTKSRKKGDYERQINIAQLYCDWIKEFQIPVDPNNRIQLVYDAGGSVAEYLKPFEKG